ncbi:carbonic anhydrase 9 isoform X2 [Python bivittatus]|uniref:Carbonic anhydrase n=1 Tax=Python bivittatus TaxID=176946 RepID=A0A9F5N1E5_PYTBI|nr:carbonic anhydrase 9 isoform X2 [Python bivittatus]
MPRPPSRRKQLIWGSSTKDCAQVEAAAWSFEARTSAQSRMRSRRSSVSWGGSRSSLRTPLVLPGLPGHKDRHWSYRDMPEWASMFPNCGGHMQSPINIDTAAASFSSKLEPLLLSGYDVPPNETLPLKNNGHTLLLGLPNKMTLSGGGFPQPYQAVQLHLHWGTGHTRPGSEHTVDGHRYAGEIHVVHYSSHFDSFQEAASEPGGLAVLAAFLQVGLEINEPYQHILKHLSDIKEEGEETVVAGFDVTKLLPDNFDRYFRYNGSLTTPPCYQTVNWTVFNQTVRLSQDQISVLEDTLQGEDDEPIQSNFRLPQSLYGRSVLSSFHILQRVQPPGEGPSEGGDQPEPGAGGGLPSSLPDGTPREGPVTASGKDVEKQVGSSLHTGDILAILFGSLFAVTALAFLFYVHKHRSQTPRLRAGAAKPTAIYAPATTDENAL